MSNLWSEADYQTQIMLLGSFFYKRLFVQEIPILTENNTQRFIDFAFVYPRSVVAFELKADLINEEQVNEKMRAKYCQALKNTFPNRKISLTFISPNDLEFEARRQIERLNTGLDPITYNVNLRHETFDSFLYSMVHLLIEEVPTETQWHYITSLIPILSKFRKDHIFLSVLYLQQLLQEMPNSKANIDSKRKLQNLI